jgi:hypothetical protein
VGSVHGQEAGTAASPSTTRRRRDGSLPGTSKQEIALRCELGEFFNTGHDKRDRAVWVDGKRYDTDIVLPDIGIIVEYDSAFERLNWQCFRA